MRWTGRAVRVLVAAAMVRPHRGRGRKLSVGVQRFPPAWLDEGGEGGEEGGEGGSGVREPRRPGPNLPVGAVALEEPASQGTAMGRSGSELSAE